MTVQEFFDALNGGASWAAGVSFQRSNPVPLEKYSAFETYAKAVEYATTNAVAYPTQMIAAYSDGTEEGIEKGIGFYFIDENMQLQPFGTKIDIDELSLNYNAEGMLEISGFKAADALTLPQKQADGTIEWVGIDTIVEGDGNTTYKFALTTNKTGLVITPVNEGVDGTAVTFDFDVYTKAEVDDKVKELSDAIGVASSEGVEATGLHALIEDNADEIARVEGLLQAAIDDGDGADLDSIKDLVNWVNTHGEAAAGMVEDIEALQGEDTAIKGRLDSLEQNSATKTELENLETSLYEGSYTKNDETITSNIAEADQAASRLISPDEIAKLSALVLGEDGSVGVSGTISADNVTGLAAAVESTVTGSNALNIEKGAQVNVIETVKVNGTALEVTDKAVDITVPTDYLTSTDKTELAGLITAAQTKAEQGVTDAAAAKSVADEAKATADTNKANLETLSTTVGGHTTQLATLNETVNQNGSSITALQTTVGEHSGSIGTLQTDLTNLTGRVGQNETDIAALKAKDTELAGLISTNTGDITNLKTDNETNKTNIKANSDAIAILVGTVEGDNTKSVRTIAEEVLVTALVPEGAKESLDTLQEIAAWIQSHPDDAAAMNSAIATLNADASTEGSVDYKIAQSFAQDFILNGGTASTNLYVAATV